MKRKKTVALSGNGNKVRVTIDVETRAGISREESDYLIRKIASETALMLTQRTPYMGDATLADITIKP